MSQDFLNLIFLMFIDDYWWWWLMIKDAWLIMSLFQMNDWDNWMNFSVCWELQFICQIAHFLLNRKWFFSQWEQLWQVGNLISLFTEFRLHNIDKDMILEHSLDLLIKKLCIMMSVTELMVESRRVSWQCLCLDIHDVYA